MTLVAVLSVLPTGTESAADQGQIFDDVLLMATKSVDCGDETLMVADGPFRNVEAIGDCFIEAGVLIKGNIKVRAPDGSLTVEADDGAKITKIKGNIRTEGLGKGDESNVDGRITILGGLIEGHLEYLGSERATARAGRDAKLIIEDGLIKGHVGHENGGVVEFTGGTIGNGKGGQLNCNGGFIDGGTVESPTKISNCSCPEFGSPCVNIP